MLDWTQSYFKNKNFSSPRLDAELLLAHTLQLTRMQLYLNFDRLLTASELAAYKALIKRRSEREPVAYILGQKDFFSRTFQVSPAVLVPRPDSETLIEETFKLLKGSTQTELHGFEIGLGSGCLSITLLCEVSTLHMTAIDISAAALQIASQNANTHAVTERLHMHAADFLNPTRSSFDFWQKKYDFIIANPPYISEAEFKTLDADVNVYEPKIALTADQDGLAFYAPIAEFAKTHLQQNGFVMVEIGNEQGVRVQKIFRDAGFEDVVCKKDYGGHDRVVIAKSS